MQGMEGLLEVLFGGGEGSASGGSSGWEGLEPCRPGSSPLSKGCSDPVAADLFVKESDGGGLEVFRTNAGGFADAEELGEGKEGEGDGAAVRGGGGTVGKEEEKVGGGPELNGRWTGDGLESAGHGPVERSDSGREQGQGFQLADGREEAAGCSGRAGMGGHVMQDRGEHFRMGHGGVASVKEGKGAEVGKVRGGGARGPTADGSGEWGECV